MPRRWQAAAKTPLKKWGWIRLIITPIIIGFFILGLIIVGIISWLIASGRAQKAEALVTELRQQSRQKDNEISQLRSDLSNEKLAGTEAITRLDASRKAFEEQKLLLESMKKEMTDTFNALSSAALKSSSEDFLRLASQHLGNIVTDTKGRLGEHQTAIDGMIKPLHETLKRYENQIRSIEEGRHKAYGGIEEKIMMLA